MSRSLRTHRKPLPSGRLAPDSKLTASSPKAAAEIRGAFESKARRGTQIRVRRQSFPGAQVRLREQSLLGAQARLREQSPPQIPKRRLRANPPWSPNWGRSSDPPSHQALAATRAASSPRRISAVLLPPRLPLPRMPRARLTSTDAPVPQRSPDETFPHADSFNLENIGRHWRVVLWFAMAALGLAVVTYI